MNEDNYLILIKGKDKTTQIQSFEIQDSVVRVTFVSSPKAYSFALENFVVLQNCDVFDITSERVVYQNDIPLYNVSRMIDFGTKVRIMLNNGTSCLYDAESIRIESSSITTSTARDILQYWTTISKHTGIAEEDLNQDTFLKKQFDKLTFVSPRSVLSCYLDGNLVKVEPRMVSETIFPFKFNLSQKDALNNALHSQISIIEGPPGTGKTQTILNILANLVMQNKSVAVVSGNNAAVENVGDKLKAAGYGFLLAELGKKENRERFFKNPPRQDVSAWKSDIEGYVLLARIEELNGRLHHLMKTEREKAQLQRELSAYLLEQEHFELYYTRQDAEQIRKLSFYRLTPEKILSFLIDNHMAVERGRAETILYKFKLIVRYGFINLNQMKNQGIDVLLGFQRKYYELKVEQVERKIATLQNKLDQESFELLLRQHQQISEQLFRHKLHQKYINREPIRSSANTYKKDFGKLIEQYPIMLSTTHSLRNCIPENFLFDYVIIDESSQVDLLTGALALSCCKHVIVVGDMKQLPQIVDVTIQEKFDMQEMPLGGAYDYFRHNLLSSMLDLYGDTVPKVMLREHYRCHPKIIEFCNQKYYDGQLITFTTEEEDDSPLVIYRTVQGNHMREVNHGQKGKFNQRELDVIEHEVLTNLGSANRSDSDIGVTTPYRKQVEKAVSQLRSDIEIETVHKYQGREKPTMILSTVLDGSRRGKMGLKFVNDDRMINVAVSRAQERFILVTDHSLFRNRGREIGDLIRYMEYSTLDDNIVESEIVSVFDLLYKEYSEKLREFKNRVKQRSKYVSENIMWTLLGEILQDTDYNTLEYRAQVFVRNLLNDMNKLGDEERRYVNNGASVDFVIHRKLDKSPVLAIEVDGFAFHENNPRQLDNDRLKDHIFDAYGLPLLRLPTTGSGEELRIRMKLNEIM